MTVEPRARITLLLPAPTTLPQHLLVDQVLTQLMLACGGVTVSSEMPSVIGGLWWDRSTGQVVADDILLVIADAPLGTNDAHLLKYLGRLKRDCQVDFAQDLIWLTVHPIERIIIATEIPSQAPSRCGIL